MINKKSDSFSIEVDDEKLSIGSFKWSDDWNPNEIPFVRPASVSPKTNIELTIALEKMFTKK